MRLFAIILLTLCVQLAGCDSSSTASNEAVLVLAAASTVDGMEDALAAYEGSAPKLSGGASSALANQILAGAPADIFLSANVKWADSLATKGLVVERRPMLANRLVIVVPKGNPAGIARPVDLLKPEVERIALAGRSVPAGIYARQALEHSECYESLRLDGRIARGADVRRTLAFVETGEVQAGIVYATDARVADGIETVHTFPLDAHDPIVCQLILLNQRGRSVFEYLCGESGRQPFLKRGFTAPK